MTTAEIDVRRWTLRAALAGVKTVIAYPHVLSGATRCYVSVYIKASDRAAKTAAAQFSY